MDVIIEFMDGRTEHASLLNPFVPQENKISAVLAKDGLDGVFPLSEICCIRMEQRQTISPEREKIIEEVVTATGKSHHVTVLLGSCDPQGFYGVSTDKSTPYQLIFFTNHGIVSRTQQRRIGDILADEGLVTRYSIDSALETQKRLREKRLGEIISEQNELPQRTIENVIEQAYLAGKVTPRMKIGDILINASLISREQLDDALASQERGKKIKLGTLLIERGLITEEQLLMVLALKFRLSFVDLNVVTPQADVMATIPADVVYGLRVLPLEGDAKRLVVATSEPTDYTIPDSLSFYTKRRIEMVVATPQLIGAAIMKYYPKQEYGVQEIISGMAEEARVIEPDEEVEYVSELDSHIIALVNRILLDAYSKGASDIHFEPGARRQPCEVRYRIDGVCHVVHEIPKMFKKAVISRLKIMSNLDISERRRPQSGKILMMHREAQIEYRLETVPTVGGNEDAVLRILASSKPRPLDDMGFTTRNMERFKRILLQPYGLILCVGPTGSGKTTTLHAALNYLNTPEIKIWTVEDPVEITQPGLRQVQVHPKIGLTFHEALRSFLRSDPDVIMVGEMRDAETAKTAIQASLTGHLVLSTLHTNSASETVVRLIDIGIDPVNVADCLLGVLAQRLVRRLCDMCKKPDELTPEEFDRLKNVYRSAWPDGQEGPAFPPDGRFMRRVGCDACDRTGYKGRVAVHELLLNSPNVKRHVHDRASVDELRALAMEEGMQTLIMDGLQKIFEGTTDLDEVLKVCRFDGFL